MFKRKNKEPCLEIEQDEIKKLKVYEKISADYNEFGHSVYYIRVPGGLIRTVVMPDTINQVFIPLDTHYFTLSVKR